MASAGLMRKYKHDKQVLAVISNMKEQQNLDKVYDTLRLEQAHALKLLRLDYVEAKTRQSRMENRVSKIRSYLSADDIADMKLLESQGKLPFKVKHTSDSTLRIASAAQRLKLRPSRGRSPASSLRRRSSRTDTPRLQTTTSCPNQETFAARRMSCSSNAGQLRASSTVSLGQQPEKRPNSVHFRDYNVQILDAGVSESPELRRRGQNAVDGGDARAPFRRTARALTATGYSSQDQLVGEKCRPKTANDDMYSSHDARRSTLEGSSPSTKRGALLPTTLADAKARERADDRRRELLVGEHVFGEQLEKKKRQFLYRTASWVEENPPFAAFDPVAAARERKLANSSELSLHSEVPEEDIHQMNVNDLWKDLRKCRYLRVDDVDLSGMNTMASEQMDLYQSMAKPRAVKDGPKKNLGKLLCS
ncbi:hypothetical protein LSH36_295g02013 [Paralvinella palmiformis]|uniref:Uncharacterized protein n=1 Tax=Paralvinella palmiformis TaxID=53620 RepID=A0AAD9JJA2_9ANNE|nr:hypothetical protein LSH36_295g02013 [Paralvinella palmiformis]